MLSVGNKMDNKSDYQFLVMQTIIYSNRRDSDEKMNNITEIVEKIMEQIQISIFLYR